MKDGNDNEKRRAPCDARRFRRLTHDVCDAQARACPKPSSILRTSSTSRGRTSFNKYSCDTLKAGAPQLIAIGGKPLPGRKPTAMPLTSGCHSPNELHTPSS